MDDGAVDGGRGPRSTSTRSPTTSGCCRSRRRPPRCGRSSRPTATATARSRSARRRWPPGADGLCVALTDEGVALREAGIDAPILVLSEQPARRRRRSSPTPDPDGLTRSMAIDALAGATRRPPARRVHLKIDTGMHRVGATPADAAASSSASPDMRCAALGRRVHPPRRRRRAGRPVHRPARPFDEVLAELPPLDARPRRQLGGRLPPTPGGRSFAPASRCTGSRPGPASTTSPRRCARRWRSRPGCRSSSGWRPATGSRTGCATRSRRRRGDGPDRLRRRRAAQPVRTGGDVLIGGRRRGSSASITMDQLMVDCGDDDVAVGDEVVLIGRQGDERSTPRSGRRPARHDRLRDRVRHRPASRAVTSGDSADPPSSIGDSHEPRRHVAVALWSLPPSLDATHAVAVASVGAPGRVIVLAGEMGAGKTAFAQGFGGRSV